MAASFGWCGGERNQRRVHEPAEHDGPCGLFIRGPCSTRLSQLKFSCGNSTCSCDHNHVIKGLQALRVFVSARFLMFLSQILWVQDLALKFQQLVLFIYPAKMETPSVSLRMLEQFSVVIMMQKDVSKSIFCILSKM